MTLKFFVHITSWVFEVESSYYSKIGCGTAELLRNTNSINGYNFDS